MRIKVNYSRDSRPTSAVINASIAKHFGAVHGLSLCLQNEEDYAKDLQVLVQQFVYRQKDIRNRDDIENRMLKDILANKSRA